MIDNLNFYIVKLDDYFENKSYGKLFSILFKYYKLPIKKTFNELELNYNSYRSSLMRNNISDDYINKFLIFFDFMRINLDDKMKYESLLSKIYYCCYYNNYKKYDYYLNEIDILLNKKNILQPVLVLYKVFIWFHKEKDIKKCILVIKNDLDYLKFFLDNDFFSADLEYLCLLMIYYFADNNVEEKISQLLPIYPKLSWIYYSVKAGKKYFNEKDSESIMYYVKLAEEYKNFNNMSKYFHVINNLAYSYNLEGEYIASLSYTENVIGYLFSSADDYPWAQYILTHYLYSKLMLNKFDDIINFINIFMFDVKFLNEISAIICLISIYFTKSFYMFKEVDDLCKERDYKLYKDIKEFLKTENDSILVMNNDNKPYSFRIKRFLINELSKK